MRVIVCGTRQRVPASVNRWLLERLGHLAADSTVIEGGSTGIDNLARRIAEALGIRVETFKARWDLYGKGAGPKRNQAMLDSGVDLVIALPGKYSRGTFDMIRRANKAGVPVEIKEA